MKAAYHRGQLFHPQDQGNPGVPQTMLPNGITLVGYEALADTIKDLFVDALYQ